MGRPLNKRFFGANAGNNIKVQFHNGTASVNGYIVKQTGTRRFKVRAYGVNTPIFTCTLTDSGTLTAGLMNISVKTDAAVVSRVSKITAHFVVVGGVRVKWDFSASTTDGQVEIEEAGTAGTATAVGADDFASDDANN
jgi:hypothetical protein